MNHVLQTTAVLCVRELTHFIRQRNRLIGAFLQPLLFWVLIGTGMNPTFQSPVDGFSYMDFFFTGIVLMILLFTSIFATMSIIDDRNSGFLQGVLASPAPRIGIVLGKAAGWHDDGHRAGIAAAAVGLDSVSVTGTECRRRALVACHARLDILFPDGTRRCDRLGCWTPHRAITQS